METKNSQFETAILSVVSKLESTEKFVLDQAPEICKQFVLEEKIVEGTDLALFGILESTKKTEVYRQVRRYAEEGQITGLVLVAPWHGIGSFKVDKVPVIVIDTNVNSI